MTGMRTGFFLAIMLPACFFASAGWPEEPKDPPNQRVTTVAACFFEDREPIYMRFREDLGAGVIEAQLQVVGFGDFQKIPSNQGILAFTSPSGVAIANLKSAELIVHAPSGAIHNGKCSEIHDLTALIKQDLIETYAAGLDISRLPLDTQTWLATQIREHEAATDALRAELEALIATLESELSETDANRLVEAAAAQALRARQEDADAELTAMTLALALEGQRRRAEETLTLLAAAQAAADGLAEAERQAALLAVANAQLATAEAATAESQRQVVLLNEQVAALRQQLGALQGLLDASAARDAAAEVQIANLGSQLNAALARIAAEQQQLAREQSRVAELEAAEAARLAAEAQ